MKTQKIGIIACGNSGIDYMNLDYPVKVIRSILNLDGKEYEDFIDIKADDFYNIIENNPDIDVSTSQTATGEIAEVYNKMKSEGYTDVIVIVISSKLSGTYQGAVLAKDLVKDINVHVFDSKSVSYGEAYMVLETIKMIDRGFEPTDIIIRLEKIRASLKTYVLVDTLKYLVKNGRLSVRSGMIGTLLKIKPLLEIQEDGSLVPKEKIRTTNKAQARLVDILQSEIKNKHVMLFIAYTNNKEKAYQLKEILEKNNDKINAILVPLTPVVGAHAGPGTIGIGFIDLGDL